MRITGGREKGRRLATLKGTAIRPTSDKIRETVFNLLGQDMTETRVLDVFAGTGSLGIEALSRGASYALFVDRSARSIALIQDNLRRCGLEDRGEVFRGDVTAPSGRKFLRKGTRFNCVFLDPPYRKGLLPPVLEWLSGPEILDSPSLMVVESFKTDELPTRLKRCVMSDQRIYGETKITIYSCE